MDILPPGRFLAHSVADCGFSANVCVALRRVTMNHERSGSRVRSAGLPLFASKADIFLVAVNSSLSHTLAQSHVAEVITRKPVA